MIARDDGTPDFHALRNRRRGREVVLFAFDLIGHGGDDLCGLPLIERKQRLKKLIGRSKQRAIQFNEHLTGDGPTVFDHVCRMGLEGIVSKRVDAPYRSGPSKTWLKSKKSGERGGAPGARGGVALATPSGHQMRELGSIDVMRLDQTLGQSRHVACASSCTSMKLPLKKGSSFTGSPVSFQNSF